MRSNSLSCKNPQQLYLNFFVQLTDFIQKNGAVHGPFKSPALPFYRTRESAPFMSKTIPLPTKLSGIVPQSTLMNGLSERLELLWM